MPKKVNVIISILTISDVIMMGGFGMLAPIFAVYVNNRLIGGNLEVIGIAQAILLFTKSIIQIPIASFLDKRVGEKDDFWAMTIGSISMCLIPLLYLYMTSPLELYVIQFFYGVISAVVFASWFGIFTRHIDKNRESMSWSVYQSSVNVSGAFAAFIGGVIAFRYGYDVLFYLISILALIGSFLLLFIYNQMLKPSVNG